MILLTVNAELCQFCPYIVFLWWPAMKVLGKCCRYAWNLDKVDSFESCAPSVWCFLLNLCEMKLKFPGIVIYSRTKDAKWSRRWESSPWPPSLASKFEAKISHSDNFLAIWHHDFPLTKIDQKLKTLQIVVCCLLFDSLYTFLSYPVEKCMVPTQKQNLEQIEIEQCPFLHVAFRTS